MELHPELFERDPDATDPNRAPWRRAQNGLTQINSIPRDIENKGKCSRVNKDQFSKKLEDRITAAPSAPAWPGRASDPLSSGCTTAGQVMCAAHPSVLGPRPGGDCSTSFVNTMFLHHPEKAEPKGALSSIQYVHGVKQHQEEQTPPRGLTAPRDKQKEQMAGKDALEDHTKMRIASMQDFVRYDVQRVSEGYKQCGVNRALMTPGQPSNYMMHKRQPHPHLAKGGNYGVYDNAKAQALLGPLGAMPSQVGQEVVFSMGQEKNKKRLRVEACIVDEPSTSDPQPDPKKRKVDVTEPDFKEAEKKFFAQRPKLIHPKTGAASQLNFNPSKGGPTRYLCARAVPPASGPGAAGAAAGAPAAANATNNFDVEVLCRNGEYNKISNDLHEHETGSDPNKPKLPNGMTRVHGDPKLDKPFSHHPKHDQMHLCNVARAWGKFEPNPKYNASDPLSTEPKEVFVDWHPDHQLYTLGASATNLGPENLNQGSVKPRGCEQQMDDIYCAQAAYQMQHCNQKKIQEMKQQLPPGMQSNSDVADVMHANFVMEQFPVWQGLPPPDEDDGTLYPVVTPDARVLTNKKTGEKHTDHEHFIDKNDPNRATVAPARNAYEKFWYEHAARPAIRTHGRLLQALTEKYSTPDIEPYQQDALIRSDFQTLTGQALPIGEMHEI